MAYLIFSSGVNAGLFPSLRWGWPSMSQGQGRWSSGASSTYSTRRTSRRARVSPLRSLLQDLEKLESGLLAVLRETLPRPSSGSQKHRGLPLLRPHISRPSDAVHFGLLCTLVLPYTWADIAAPKLAADGIPVNMRGHGGAGAGAPWAGDKGQGSGVPAGH